MEEFMLARFHWYMGAAIAVLTWIWWTFLEIPKNQRWQQKTQEQIRRERLTNIFLGILVSVMFGSFSAVITYGIVGAHYGITR